MKVPCLNVCVSNKGDQRHLVICNLKICFCAISEVPLQAIIETLCLSITGCLPSFISIERVYEDKIEGGRISPLPPVLLHAKMLQLNFFRPFVTSGFNSSCPRSQNMKLLCQKPLVFCDEYIVSTGNREHKSE